MKERFNSVLCIAKKTFVPFKILKSGLILCFSALILSAAAHPVPSEIAPSEKITLSVSNAPLRQLFKTIEEQSGYVFLHLGRIGYRTQ